VSIVTGANTGIGKETARELARNGAHVIVAARSVAKGIEAVTEIKRDTGSDKVEYIELDLSSIASVDKFAVDFKAKFDKLHLLVNNAGYVGPVSHSRIIFPRSHAFGYSLDSVMACPFALSDDEIEMQFAVNHLGHFHLTSLLEDLLVKSAPSRIVIVSSAAHFIPDMFSGKPDFNDVNVMNSLRYNPWAAYGRSKLANVLHANELNERLGSKGVLVNSLHPGGVQTELQRHLVPSWLATINDVLMSALLLSPSQGALTSLYAATSLEIAASKEQARYFVPIALAHPKAAMGEDKALQKELWETSERLIHDIKEKGPKTRRGYDTVNRAGTRRDAVPDDSGTKPISGGTSPAKREK
jgi:NAD(P)-dependent dehydrogenase (short-subunit alcohol dehydrogenase family)